MSRQTAVGIAMALALTVEAGRAQTKPEAISLNFALGVAGQNYESRALLGPAVRVGVTRALAPRVHLGADLTVQRFGYSGDFVYAPCPIGTSCPTNGAGAATFVNATALLLLREESAPTAYLVGGGGVTRLVVSEESSTRRTYAHVTGGIGWDLAWQGVRPFFEFRFKRYLWREHPMSSWSMPVLVGLRF